MQYHAIPYNTMQYHASLITTDGAYHCPVGSIWQFCNTLEPLLESALHHTQLSGRSATVSYRAVTALTNGQLKRFGRRRLSQEAGSKKQSLTDNEARNSWETRSQASPHFSQIDWYLTWQWFSTLVSTNNGCERHPDWEQGLMVPDTRPLPDIFFDTKPDQVQFWKSSGIG